MDTGKDVEQLQNVIRTLEVQNEKLRNKSRNGTPVKTTLHDTVNRSSNLVPTGSNPQGQRGHSESQSDPLGDLGEPNFTEYEQECMER